MKSVAFKSEGFREFDAKACPKIRTSTDSPLILVKPTGEVVYARLRDDKDALVARYSPEEDLLLFAWHGSWRTDVFVLTHSDLQECYE